MKYFVLLLGLIFTDIAFAQKIRDLLATPSGFSVEQRAGDSFPITAEPFSPSITNETNVSVTPFTANAVRIGSMVLVSGVMNIDPVSDSTITSFSFALPITSIAGAFEGGGTLVCSPSTFTNNGTTMRIYSISSNGRYISFDGHLGFTPNTTCGYNFGYRVK